MLAHEFLTVFCAFKKKKSHTPRLFCLSQSLVAPPFEVAVRCFSTAPSSSFLNVRACFRPCQSILPPSEPPSFPAWTYLMPCGSSCVSVYRMLPRTSCSPAAPLIVCRPLSPPFSLLPFAALSVWSAASLAFTSDLSWFVLV